MSAIGQHHPGEEELERYSLGNATEEESANFEEHLLLCQRCRDRLDEVDAYHWAMGRAAAAVRRQERESRVSGFPSRLIWAVAASLAMAGAVMVFREAPGVAPVPAVGVALEATRGPLSPAPANRPLLLRPDLSGLPDHEKYLMEVVDGRAKPLWQGTLQARDPQVTLPGRSPGTYFIRIYSPSRELLREYGLDVKN